MTGFQIETVKWSWAAKVQNKNVYRDDEFVRTKSKEEALGAIEFLMRKPQGLTYTITVFRDGEYFTYYRHSMPCLGGLVKYRDSHGEKHHMNPYFPRDIRVAFPEGEIIYIAQHRPHTGTLFNSTYFQFIFSEESPWVSAFGSMDTMIFEDNYFVLTNMNTDPTVFYSLMRQGGLYGGYGSVYSQNKHHPKASILGFQSFQSDPRRLAGQKPIRISGGTWAEGFGYTRPYNESIFKTSLPHKFKDFKTLAGYPQAAYSSAYFVAEMKSNFGVDLSRGISGNLTDKIAEALVQAWDYFKEKSKELSEFAD